MIDTRVITYISLLSCASAIIMAILILLGGSALPPRLPLFYSLAWGEEQLATLQQFLIIPSLVIAISLINLMISWQLHQSQYFFKLILNFTSLLCVLILIISTVKIVLIFL